MINHPLPVGTMVRYQDDNSNRSEINGIGWIGSRQEYGASMLSSNGYYIMPFPWMRASDHEMNEENGVVYMYDREIVEVIEVSA